MQRIKELFKVLWPTIIGLSIIVVLVVIAASTQTPKQVVTPTPDPLGTMHNATPIAMPQIRPFPFVDSQFDSCASFTNDASIPVPTGKGIRITIERIDEDGEVVGDALVSILRAETPSLATAGTSPECVEVTLVPIEIEQPKGTIF